MDAQEFIPTSDDRARMINPPPAEQTEHLIELLHEVLGLWNVNMTLNKLAHLLGEPAIKEQMEETNKVFTEKAMELGAGDNFLLALTAHFFEPNDPAAIMATSVLNISKALNPENLPGVCITFEALAALVSAAYQTGHLDATMTEHFEKLLEGSSINDIDENGDDAA